MALLIASNRVRLPLWSLFLIFALSNAFLAYGDISYSAKAWVALFGLLIPFLIDVLGRKDEGEGSFQKEVIVLEPSVLFWSVAFGAAFFLRFYRLTNFHLWPTGDEGLHGFLAIPLTAHWDWRFFYTVGEHPPLLIWALAPFFKFIGSPFFDLWFLPAFFSILAVPAGYWACRRFFSKSLSLLFGFLIAFSFWPLYFGRFCHQGLFTPFWEMAGFFLLGSMFQANTNKKKLLWALGTGLWVGLGSLTFTAWAVVIALFTLIVIAYGWAHRAEDWKSAGIFFAGLSMGVFPFVRAAIHEGYGRHLIDTSAASHWFDSAHQWVTHLSYITCLFWGSLQSDSSYAPTWGGILNPLLTACFFIGLLELIHSRKQKESFWLLAALVLLFLPGLLSADYVEFNRVIQVLPALLLVTAIGMQKLVQELPQSKQWVLVPFLFCSFALDATHLLKPVTEGPVWKLNFKQDLKEEGLEAYRVLEAEYRQKGPGIILVDLLPLSHGHMLHVTTYHFNAAINPELDPAEATWMAVIVNEDYQKPLQKLFPNATWVSVTSQTPELGGMKVGIVPVTSQNSKLVRRWLEVHRYFYQLNLQAENMYNNPKAYQANLQSFQAGYSLVQGDRFLESCFGEWTTQFHWGGDYRMNIQLAQRTIQKGYPCAHLYFKLGQLYLFDHQLDDSRKAFRQALKCQPNGTAAKEWLAAITPANPAK